MTMNEIARINRAIDEGQVGTYRLPEDCNGGVFPLLALRRFLSDLRQRAGETARGGNGSARFPISAW